MREIVVVAHPQVVLVHATVAFQQARNFDLVSRALLVLVLGLAAGFPLGWGGSALPLVPAELAGEHGHAHDNVLRL